MKTKPLVSLLALLTLCSDIMLAAPIGTGFTYQGRLNDGEIPAQGIYDLRFTIYDASGGGSVIAGPLTNTAVAVSNGLFTVALDFGANVFTGDARWLEIGVRTNGSGAFTTLTPRQALSAAPYALHAPSAGWAAGATTASGVAAGAVGSAGLQSGAVTSAKIAAGGVMASNVTAASFGTTFWKADGNSGTTGGTHFLGTTDNQPLELKVNNTRALRLAWNANCPIITAGYSNNLASGAGAVICGGGKAGDPNLAAPMFAFLGGGGGNSIGSSADFSALVGGERNTIQAYGTNSFIGGGSFNTIRSNGAWATIPGGDRNSATNRAFAAGTRAKANHTGAFVWADATDADFASTSPNQFLIRAAGGVGIGTNQPVSALHVAGTVTASGFSGSGSGLTNVNGGALTPGSVSSAALSDNAVTGAKILDGTIGVADVAPETFVRLAGDVMTGPLSNNVSITGVRFFNLANSGDGFGSVALGGTENVVGANWHATIGGGHNNIIQSNAGWTTIGGGGLNSIQSGADGSTIAGGELNSIHSDAVFSSLGGGIGNAIQAMHATICGGVSNIIQTNAFRAAIGGGYGNTVHAGAAYSIVPGGRDNASAGSYSMAAGRQAKALHSGTFVWADSTSVDFASTADNQFLIRATGGVGIGTNNPASALHVAGVVMAAGFGGSGAGLTGLSAGSLSGTVTNPLMFAPASGAPFAVGNNNLVTNLNADSLDGLDSSVFWKTDGNSGTTGGTHFLGTTDNQTLELRVNNVRGFWLQAAPDAWGTYGVNLVGGSVSNSVADGFGGVTIFGGSTNAPNHVEGNYATVSGGRGNTIGLGAQWATISGGRGNLIDVRGEDAVISGGSWNSVGTFAMCAAIGGGQENEIEQDAVGATIAGGLANLVESGSESAAIGGGTLNWAWGNHAFIGGGYANRALDDCATIGGGFAGTASTPGSTVGGGSNNQASAACAFVGGGSGNAATAEFAAVAGGMANWADGLSSVIAGGYWNTARGTSATIGGGDTNLADHLYATITGGAQNSATNNYATVGGGMGNTAGGDKSAVCGGTGNLANGTYSFVGGGQFNRATNLWSTVSGGQGCAAYGTHAAVPGGHLNYATGNYSLAAGRRAKANHQGSFVWGDSSSADVTSSTNDEFTVRASGGARIFSNSNLTSGVTLAAGGGSWSTVSDRAAKRDFRATDPQEILRRLAGIPVQTWSYTSQDAAIRHIGPVAQDFAAAFQVGEDNRRITTTDADGVALAAIQGLNLKLEARSQAAEVRSRELEAKNAELTKEVAELKALVQTLAAKVNGGGP